MIDMSRKSYGKLTVTSLHRRDNHGQLLWQYKCSCGNVGIANGYDIRSGHTKSCGRCRKNEFEDLGEYGIFVIHLESGDTAAVSYGDEELVKNHHWFIGGNGYVCTSINGKRFYLHKMIAGVNGKTIVDHIDRCKMDNRSQNLRIANKSLNGGNAKLRSDSKNTGHKNIKYDRRYNNYSVRVTKDGVTHYGGTFKNILDAIPAANSLRKKLYGEFAYYDSNNYVEPLIGLVRSSHVN